MEGIRCPIPALRFVGYALDVVLAYLFGWGVYTVLTDGYGLGVRAGPEGVFFTLGGLATWALLLALFFRPVGRVASLQMVAVIRFLHKVFWYLFGGPRGPTM